MEFTQFFRKLGKMDVLHRVDRDTGDGFVTKGDNNDNEDFGIVSKSEDYNGKLLIAIPYLGYALMYFRDNIYLALPVIALFFVFGQWFARREAYRDAKE